MTSENTPKMGPWQAVAIVAVIALILLVFIAGVIGLIKWGIS